MSIFNFYKQFIGKKIDDKMPEMCVAMGSLVFLSNIPQNEFPDIQ